jgi:hypothetical protein
MGKCAAYIVEEGNDKSMRLECQQKHDFVTRTKKEHICLKAVHCFLLPMQQDGCLHLSLFLSLCVCVRGAVYGD